MTEDTHRIEGRPGAIAPGDVERLVRARGCRVANLQDTFCLILAEHPAGRPEYAPAQDGGFLAADIFRACTRANRRRIPAHEPRRGTVLDRSFHNLKEDMIAELIAADGVAPYRGAGRTIALEALLRTASVDTRRLGHGDRPEVRRAAQAVADAGLAFVRVGPRGGFANAELEWALWARRRGNVTLGDPRDDAALLNLVAP